MALTLRDGVSLAEVEDGIALLDEEAGQYWALNPTGALVLQTMLAGGTTDQATQLITEEYAVDAATAGQDVDELLTALRDAGLVEPEQRPAEPRRGGKP